MPPRVPRYSEKQKPKNVKKTLLRLWKYLFAYKGMLITAFIMTIAGNLLALLGPMLSGKAIDAIGKEAGKVDFDRVFYYAALMAVFYVVSAVFSYLLSIIMINLSQKIVYKMRKDVFSSLADLPVGFFDKHQTGDIVSRISYDIDTINATLSNDFLQITTSVITVVGSLVMMIVVSLPLVSVFLVTIPISVFLTKYMTEKVRPLFRKRSKTLGELNGYAEEIITGHKAIKSYDRKDVITERFDERNNEAVTAYYNADYYGSMVGPCVNFVNNLSLVLISVIGAFLYAISYITIGNLSSFVLYSRKFSGPINEMANILGELQSAFSAAERVFNLIDEKPETEDSADAKELFDVKGDVEFRDVTFGYNDDKIIIHGFNLSVPHGSRVAIVGHTGAGKTTLINLLMRFYDPQKGTITIDGNDIKKVTRKSLRLSFAMVLQDTWLFKGTVYENIAYGKEGATLDEVIEAAKAARIHSYIEALPKKYDTVLNEDGINISSGQKQLITIARTMLLDAKILILDEATSNVDTRTEIRIQKAMNNLMQDKTCFIIAHRLSTIQNSDIILVVENGEVAEKGKHEELIRQNGVYAALYNSQFQ